MFFWPQVYNQLKIDAINKYAEAKPSMPDLIGPIDQTTHRCKQFLYVIRVLTALAHVTRVSDHTIIRFTTKEIVGWWCDSTTGNRPSNCLNHVRSLSDFYSSSDDEHDGVGYDR